MSVTGTLGLLVAAHRKGKIKDLRSVMDRIRKESFWIDNKLYRKIMDELE